MGSFKPPKLPAQLPPEVRSALEAAFESLYSDLRAIERSEGTVEIRTTSYRPSPGESVRVSPPSEGMAILLPAPDTSNRGSQISLHIEHPDGAVRVFVAPNASNDATVNGQEMVTFSAEGLVVFESNGTNRWQSIEAFSSASPGASALDAEYVLGAAHASLPNGRVATDSTEIDAVLTVANVVSWALNTASVAFSKLADLAGISVLGRAASSSGVMAAITATAAYQWLQSDSAGTALEWAGQEPRSFAVNFTGTLTNYVLPSGMRPGDVLLVTLTGNTTLNSIEPPLGTSRNFWFHLHLVFQNGGDFTLSIPNNGTASGNGRNFRTPGQDHTTLTAYTYVMQSEEESVILTYVTTTAEIWRISAGTAAQTVDGDITIPTGKGGTRTAAITAGAIVNADVNASAAIALSKLATQAAETFNGNFTAGAAVPTARAGSSVAGGGLTYTAGGTLAVGAGTGITVNANDVAVSIPLTDGDKGDITVASSGASWTIDSNVVTAAKLAVLASNVAPVVAVFFSIPAGAGGSADDVTLFSSDIPHDLRWIEWRVIITTTVALATVEVRSASGGGGTSLSSVFVAAIAGEAALSASWTATATSASGTSAFLRRSDSGVALDLVGYYVKT